MATYVTADIHGEHEKFQILLERIDLKDTDTLYILGYIFRHNNHIAIDCGACFPEGRLAAICLDTDEEYYIESV